MPAYDAVADRYDRSYSSLHEFAENYLLADIMRRFEIFDVEGYTPAPLRVTASGLPDRRLHYDIDQSASETDKRAYRRELGEGSITPTRRFLDIGCGTGLAIELSRLVNRELPTSSYLGIDPSKPMIEQARKKFPHTFALGDAETAAAYCAGRKFERVVSLFGPLNYADPDKAFRSLRNCTAEGGKIFLVVYTKHHVRDPNYILKNNPPPTTYFDTDSLRRLLDGFDIHISGMSPPKFYKSRLGTKKLRVYARYLLRYTAPNDCAFLVVKGRRHG